MGRMHDALRKAEEEREKKRLEEDASDPTGLSKPVIDKNSGKKTKKVEATDTIEATKVTSSQRAVDKTEAMSAVDADSQKTPRPGILGALKAVTPPAPVRGASSPGSRLVAVHSPNDYRVEQFRAVRSNLQALDPVPQVLGFTSALENEGSSLVVANLACVFAEERGIEILVVDANMRNSDVHELLGINARTDGLAEVLNGGREPLDVVRASSVPHVSFVSAGIMTDNPGGLLPSRRMTEAMAVWRRKFDYVLVDTPAILGVNDAAVVGHHVDGMVLVLKLGATPRDVADTAISGLRGAGVRLVGCVLTKRRSRER